MSMSEQKVFKTFPKDVRDQVTARLRKAGRDYSGGLNEVWHLMGDERPVYNMKCNRSGVRVEASYQVGGQTFTATASGGKKSAARSRAARRMMLDMGIYKVPSESATA